jgi:predicted RNase H-like HicB family nuclease
MKARDFLKRPYARCLTPDEDGGFVATIQEFPGLVAEGDSAEEALSNLDSAAESWIEAVLEMGRKVPDPVALHGYSGRVALRLPRSIHKQAAAMASNEGTSLNQFLVTAIAHYVGRNHGRLEAAKSAASEFAVVRQWIYANYATGGNIDTATGRVTFRNLSTDLQRIWRTGEGFMFIEPQSDRIPHLGSPVVDALLKDSHG